MNEQEIKEIKRRAGLTEDEGEFVPVDPEEFMRFVASAGSLITKSSGETVWFYSKTAVGPSSYAYAQSLTKRAVAVYNPRSSKGSFLVKR